MPVQSQHFPGTRSVVADSWYTSRQMKDLAERWQRDGGKEESRYCFATLEVPVLEDVEIEMPNLSGLTPEFLADLPKDKPAKFMFYANVGGGHWIGCGVIVDTDGRVTVASADSLHPEDTYNSLRGNKKIFIDDIAAKFEGAFPGNVVKKTYEHAWTQTNWRGDKGEAPSACGPYTVENMIRFLSASEGANMARNPGSLIVRERQLSRMTNPEAIGMASDSDLLMSIARNFRGQRFSNDMLQELLQNPAFRTEISFQRKMKAGSMERLLNPFFQIDTPAEKGTTAAADKGEAEGIISYMNIVLDKVRIIEGKENELLVALQSLKVEIGDDAFNSFVANGFDVPGGITDYTYGAFEMITARAALTTLTPSGCDILIRQKFLGTNPPFERIEAEKLRSVILEEDTRVAQEMQEIEGRSYEARAREEAEGANLALAMHAEEKAGAMERQRISAQAAEIEQYDQDLARAMAESLAEHQPPQPPKSAGSRMSEEDVQAISGGLVEDLMENLRTRRAYDMARLLTSVLVYGLGVEDIEQQQRVAQEVEACLERKGLLDTLQKLESHQHRTGLAAMAIGICNAVRRLFGKKTREKELLDKAVIQLSGMIKGPKAVGREAGR